MSNTHLSIAGDFLERVANTIKTGDPDIDAEFHKKILSHENELHKMLAQEYRDGVQEVTGSVSHGLLQYEFPEGGS